MLLKLENLQVTGSFKPRGATNRILAMEPEERSRGVVAASTGNHALGVAHALEATGLEGTIYLPEDVSASKREALERYPVELRVGGTPEEGEAEARRAAETRGATYVSPYNDPLVVAGQGTVGLEVEGQAEEVDAVFASVGGGGLISGIAGYLKHRRPEVEVVGCYPERSPAMAEAVRAGEVVDTEIRPTLSDGTAGGLEPGSVTVESCRALVDRWVGVGEEEIADAMRQVLFRDHLLVEGAAGVAVAGFLRCADAFRGRRVALVMCGGNVAADTLREVFLPPASG